LGTKTQVPAIEGWFTLDPERPALLATRCRACETYFFPRETYFCKNPDCLSTVNQRNPASRTHSQICEMTHAFSSKPRL